MTEILLLVLGLQLIVIVLLVYFLYRTSREMSDKILAKSLGEIKTLEEGNKKDMELEYPLSDELLAKKEEIRNLRMRKKLDKELARAKKDMEGITGIPQG